MKKMIKILKSILIGESKGEPIDKPMGFKSTYVDKPDFNSWMLEIHLRKLK